MGAFACIPCPPGPYKVSTIKAGLFIGRDRARVLNPDFWAVCMAVVCAVGVVGVLKCVCIFWLVTGFFVGFCVAKKACFALYSEDSNSQEFV
jgi:hypothetical protein